MMTKRGLILVLSMMLLFTAAAAENTVEILPTAAGQAPATKYCQRLDRL